MIEKVRLRSDRIRELMARKKISQKALGELINVCSQTVYYMLKRGTAAREDAQMIAVALGADLREITDPPVW